MAPNSLSSLDVRTWNEATSARCAGGPGASSKKRRSVHAVLAHVAAAAAFRTVPMVPGGTHDLLLQADEGGATSLPLMDRLKLEEQLHEADMQKRRSEQVARELRIECKAADRARRKEEQTSQMLRAECAALAQRLQAQHQQHEQLARQHEELSRRHEELSGSQAKKLAKLTAELKEQAGQMAAQREMLHRSDQRAAERQQLILQQHQQLRTAAEQEQGLGLGLGLGVGLGLSSCSSTSS